MANPEHVAVVKQGAAAIAAWREEHWHERMDLSGADLAEMQLPGADLDSAELSDANLSEADLEHARLRGATLRGTNLVGTSLGYADLMSANLSRSNLAHAEMSYSSLVGANLARAVLKAAELGWVNLSMAQFMDADLSEADLRRATFFETSLDRALLHNARLGWTDFNDCDLSLCRGLESVIHDGHSSIGVDTLVQTWRGAGSRWTPELLEFFIGAGVPRTLLEYLPDLIEQNPLQYYSSFISFGAVDAAFTDKLYESLIGRGVSCWKYDESAVMGRGVWDNIGHAIRNYDKLIVICSRDSLGRPGVLREIERALQKEDHLKKQGAVDTDVLFPIMLDDYVLNEWEHPRKADVVAKDVGDFRDPAKYDKAMERLLHALNPKAWPPKRPGGLKIPRR